MTPNTSTRTLQSGGFGVMRTMSAAGTSQVFLSYYLALRSDDKG